MTVWRCDKCLHFYCIGGTYPKDTGIEVRERIRPKLGTGTYEELNVKGIAPDSRPEGCLHKIAKPQWKSGTEMDAIREEEKEEEKKIEIERMRKEGV